MEFAIELARADYNRRKSLIHLASPKSKKELKPISKISESESFLENLEPISSIVPIEPNPIAKKKSIQHKKSLVRSQVSDQNKVPLNKLVKLGRTVRTKEKKYEEEMRQIKTNDAILKKRIQTLLSGVDMSRKVKISLPRRVSVLPKTKNEKLQEITEQLDSIERQENLIFEKHFKDSDSKDSLTENERYILDRIESRKSNKTFNRTSNSVNTKQPMQELSVDKEFRINLGDLQLQSESDDILERLWNVVFDTVISDISDTLITSAESLAAEVLKMEIELPQGDYCVYYKS